MQTPATHALKRQLAALPVRSTAPGLGAVLLRGHRNPDVSCMTRVRHFLEAIAVEQRDKLYAALSLQLLGMCYEALATSANGEDHKEAVVVAITSFRKHGLQEIARILLSHATVTQHARGVIEVHPAATYPDAALRAVTDRNAARVNALPTDAESRLPRLMAGEFLRQLSCIISGDTGTLNQEWSHMQQLLQPLLPQDADLSVVISRIVYPLSGLLTGASAGAVQRAAGEIIDQFWKHPEPACAALRFVEQHFPDIWARFRQDAFVLSHPGISFLFACFDRGRSPHDVRLIFAHLETRSNSLAWRSNAQARTLPVELQEIASECGVHLPACVQAQPRVQAQQPAVVIGQQQRSFGTSTGLSRRRRARMKPVEGPTEEPRADVPQHTLAEGRDLSEQEQADLQRWLNGLPSHINKHDFDRYMTAAGIEMRRTFNKGRHRWYACQGEHKLLVCDYTTGQIRRDNVREILCGIHMRYKSMGNLRALLNDVCIWRREKAVTA